MTTTRCPGGRESMYGFDDPPFKEFWYHLDDGTRCKCKDLFAQLTPGELVQAAHEADSKAPNAEHSRHTAAAMRAVERMRVHCDVALSTPGTKERAALIIDAEFRPVVEALERIAVGDPAPEAMAADEEEAAYCKGLESQAQIARAALRQIKGE